MIIVRSVGWWLQQPYALEVIKPFWRPSMEWLRWANTADGEAFMRRFDPS